MGVKADWFKSVRPYNVNYPQHANKTDKCAKLNFNISRNQRRNYNEKDILWSSELPTGLSACVQFGNFRKDNFNYLNLDKNKL